MCFAKKVKKETKNVKKSVRQPEAKPTTSPSQASPATKEDKEDKNEESEKSQQKSQKPAAAPPEPQSNKASKKSTKKAANSKKMTTTVAVKNSATALVQPWVQRALDMGVPALLNEFRGLAKYTPEGMTTEAFQANKDKNRYQDVPCQDKGRIIVKHPGVDNDYIHANFLGTGHNPKKFICAQGPLVNTQHAFWGMAIQEKVECIIMLCNCIEMAKIKCHQYWPEENAKKMMFGEFPNVITVTNNGMKKMSVEDPCINVTTLLVEWKEGSRTVFHYQWENWPDRGVPQTNLTAINLLSATRGNQNPILVHCSAGIGRTGTIVAIAYVQDKMMAGESCMAMSELLKELRSHRPWSIQNEFQYLYLHRVLLAYFLERHKEQYGYLLTGENGQKYQKWIDDYKLATNSKG